MRKTASRYQKASKKYKETILDEFVQSTGYHRTYASFLLSHHGKRVVIARKTSIVGDIRKRVRKKREPVYGTEGLAEALRILLNAAMLFERERFLVAAPFKQWRERLLGEMVYLQLDARYEKVREGGIAIDEALFAGNRH